MWSFELLALVPATLIAAWVAWSDLAVMKIPNKAVLALLAVFVLVGLVSLPLLDFGWRLAHFAVVLVAGFLMTITGVVGAGDAKFAAAMAPFISLATATNALAMFAISTLIAFAVHRAARLTPLRKMVPHWESWERMRDFPMGLPLAMTLVWYLATYALR